MRYYAKLPIIIYCRIAAQKIYFQDLTTTPPSKKKKNIIKLWRNSIQLRATDQETEFGCT